MKRFLVQRFDWIFLSIFFLIVGSIYSYMSVSLHNHFQTFGWDLGFFDQIIWKASRGDLWAFSTLAKENLLADHFQPVLYLLAPLYWIKSDVRMLLIAQAYLVVFAGFPLYLLAKEVTKNKIFSFSIVVSYLLFLGTQWTILNEFHQAAFVPLFLSIFFYSLYRKNWWGYWIAVVGLLGTKEEMGLLVASLGILVLIKSFISRSSLRLGIITTLIGFVTFFFLVYLLMPALSVEGKYHHMGFGEAGYTPIDVIKKSITNPQFFIMQMVTPRIKIKTIFDSYLAFGFLPLFSPLYLIPVAEQFMTRFIYAGPQFTQWANVNHHAAPLGILLAVGTIYVSLYFTKYIHVKCGWREKRVMFLLGCYIFVFACIQDILLHGPINSFFKPQFHQSFQWMKDNDDVIKLIPPEASVAAQNSILSHLSQRNEMYLLLEIHNAQYIIVDLKDGQNKFSPQTLKETEKQISNLILSGQYMVVAQKGKTILLHKSLKFS